MREKAQLVVDLLKEYFKNKDMDCYDALCLYNPDTDLTISDSPLITGEFYIITTNNKIVLDISPTRIDKVFCNLLCIILCLLKFYNLINLFIYYIFIISCYRHFVNSLMKSFLIFFRLILLKFEVLCYFYIIRLKRTN